MAILVNIPPIYSKRQLYPITIIRLLTKLEAIDILQLKSSGIQIVERNLYIFCPF